MPTRRQERVAKVVMRAVSDAIRQDLSDPRIQGLVSVTRVEMSPDLRSADIYLSVYADRPATADTTFAAIEHGRGLIQARVAEDIQSKFCPVLHFHLDDKFKKTLEVMNLIDQAAGEYQARDETEAVRPEVENDTGPLPSVQDDESREP